MKTIFNNKMAGYHKNQTAQQAVTIVNKHSNKVSK